MTDSFTRSDGLKIDFIPEPFCTICNLPMPKKYYYLDRCVPCKNKYGDHAPLIRTRAVSKYLYLKEYPDDVFSQNIREFKTNPQLASILGECMCHSLKKRFPALLESDVIIPAPTSNEKQRGYNQAELLAKYISNETGMPVDDVLYTKKGHTSVHSNDSPDKKADAISGKIGCKKTYTGQVALLIDDTYQEGHTKGECAKVLIDNGIRKVWGLVLGRAVSKKHIDYVNKTNNDF